MFNLTEKDAEELALWLQTNKTPKISVFTRVDENGYTETRMAFYQFNPGESPRPALATQPFYLLAIGYKPTMFDHTVPKDEAKAE